MNAVTRNTKANRLIDEALKAGLNVRVRTNRTVDAKLTEEFTLYGNDTVTVIVEVPIPNEIIGSVLSFVLSCEQLLVVYTKSHSPHAKPRFSIAFRSSSGIGSLQLTSEDAMKRHLSALAKEVTDLRQAGYELPELGQCQNGS